MRKKYRLLGGTLQGHNSLLQRLLKNRNIQNQEEFLNPSYETGFHDPFLLRDMDKAVARILQAIDDGESILIYSDYDADGIPAGVMMKDFFDLIQYDNAENYIPHRHKEGFGLNKAAIDEFIERKVDLLITLDCGIADYLEVEYAMKKGIDVIVTDHHEQNGDVPPAIAVIDPKREDCTYPFDGLCGAGVGWKLIQALLQTRDFGLTPGKEKWLLDMAGIATLSDMVPLVDENRILGTYGLLVLRKSRRPGITRLLRKLKINQRHLTEDDIGFMIAPRINAASRMGDPREAFFLLSSKDDIDADKYVARLEQINNERKGTVAAIAKAVKKELKKRGELPEVIATGNPDWLPSLCGLVAGSVADEYVKPVFIWGREASGKIKGSARSDGKTSLLDLMNELPHVFDQFGGHKQAGGFSVREGMVHHLEEELSKAFRKVAVKNEIEEVLLDAKLKLNDVIWETANLIDKASPFGIGNEKPLFIFENAEIIAMKLFGKQKNHLSITVRDSTGEAVNAIAFFSDGNSFNVPAKTGSIVNIVGSIEKSYFRGRPELRLRLVDIIEGLE